MSYLKYGTIKLFTSDDNYNLNNIYAALLDRQNIKL